MALSELGSLLHDLSSSRRLVLVVKAGVIYTGKVNEQKCSVSLEAWAQNSDSVL